MNLEHNPTVAELRSLIQGCDDRAGHHVLWVARNGEVHLSRIPKDKPPVVVPNGSPEMQLWYEAFQAGNQYVGPEAAEDETWVRQVFDALVTEWPKAKDKPTPGHIDQF